MDLLRLRQATAAQHAATEESVPLMGPSLTREGYVNVLRRFYSIVHAWDTWADRHAPEDLQPLRLGRRRASLLVDDLIALGEVPPLTSESYQRRMEETAVPGDCHAVFLGRMYVMEGSTLGGQHIARHLEEHLGIVHGKGNSFFVGYGDQTGARWREFKAVLAKLPDASESTVIASAHNMFQLFGEAMRGDTRTESASDRATELFLTEP